MSLSNVDGKNCLNVVQATIILGIVQAETIDLLKAILVLKRSTKPVWEA